MNCNTKIRLLFKLIQGSKVENVTSDVWFGDVWFCAGEQNMEFFMREVISMNYFMNFVLA
jgi:hypothetical protein